MLDIFADSPEYVQRTKVPFKPTTVTISDVHSVIPKELYRKSTIRGLGYAARDIFFAVAAYKLGRCIDPLQHTLAEDYGIPYAVTAIVKWLLWGFYWHWQGVILAGWWCIAHEAGHGTISPHAWINNVVGFTMHTFVLVPYYAWRSTHHAHHKATMSLERDEHFLPMTRSQYRLPSENIAHISDYHDVFEETPIYTLFRMVMMQMLGWQCYLLTNVMGNSRYPSGTNHFRPSSALFKPHERNGIIASNIGITTMIFLLYLWTKEVGLSYFIKLYFIPYILCNHWIVMLTYLHHSDPTVPYYRKSQWTFLRGALSTVDRPLLGWAGRFFLHNVSHDHISHHLFSSIPFYNQPKVTKILKTILKDDYNYDSTNSFRALYRTFTQCCFIEDNGEILFYKNREGKAVRILAGDDDRNHN